MTAEQRELAALIKEEIISSLRDAGMFLTENEAREYRRWKKDNEPLMKQTEVAAYLGVSSQTVMRLRDKGLIVPAKIINNRPYFRKQDIQKFKKS